MSTTPRKSFALRTATTALVVVLLSALLVSSVSAAAVQLDAWANIYSGSPNNNNGTIAAGNLTVSAGADRIFVVAVCVELNNANTSTFGASLGGTALTQLVTTGSTTAQEHCWLGYLLHSQIPAGSNALSVTYNVGGFFDQVNGIHIRWASYSGINQTTPFVDSNANYNAGASVTFGAQIDYVQNGLTFYAAANGGTPATMTPPTGFTQRLATTSNGHSSFTASITTAPHGANGNYPGTTSVAFGGTTSNRSAIVVASLNPLIPTTTVGDGTSPSSKTVAASQTNQAVSAFTLSTNTGTDTVTGLVVTGTNMANVAAVRLYQSANSEWEAGDTLIGTASLVGNVATFTGLNIAVTTTSTNYIITYDIVASPTAGQTMTGVVTGVTATNPVTNNDTTDATLTVGYVITITTGPGGTVQSPYGTVVTSLVVAPNATPTLYSVPNTGYIVNNVVVQGVSVGRANTYTMPPVTGNRTFAAYFDGGWSQPSAVASGSGWSNPTNGYTSNNSYASSNSFPGSNVNYINFNIPTIPPGSTINGIAVAYEGYTGNTNAIVALSGDMGSSFSGTSINTTFIVDVPDTTVILGGGTNLWGGTWAPNDFTNAEFYMRISSDNLAQLYLDQVQVKVYYTRPTVLTTTAVTGTYGGTVDLTATLTSNGTGVSGETITFTLDGNTVGTAITDINGVATLNGASLLGISAGIYPTGVGASFAGSSDGVTSYAAASDTDVLTVNQRALTITAAASNKVYDGNTTASVTFSDDHVAGDTLTITYASALFNDKNVGTGKTVTVTGINVTGADAGNYTWNTTATTTADITRRDLTVTVAADDKVYDGTADATVTPEHNGVAGDDLTISYTSALFSDKNVGNNKTVTVSGISLGGADAGNYNLLNAVATDLANIAPRTLVVSAVGQDKIYDGTTSAFVTLTHNGINGDELSLNYGSALFNSPNVGTNKPVSVSAITVTGPDAGNYTYNETTSTTANITERALHVTASALDKVYDGTTTASATTTDDHIPGDNLTVTVTSANFDTPDVGNGKTVTVFFSVSGASRTNYTWSSPVTTTADITQRAIEVTADPQTKTYGDADPPLTYTITNGSLAPGDSFSGALTRDPGEDVGVYNITVGSLDPGTNYAFTFIGNTLTILQRPVSVTPDDNSKVYGEADPALTGVLSNFLPADNISANYVRDAGETVGTYDINATLNDPLGRLGNYDVTYNTGTFTITRAPLTITADDQTKNYGELFTFTGAEFSVSGLLFSDTVTSVTLVSAGAPVTADVGAYPINASAAVGSGLSNYNITYVDGTLTVNKATVDLVVTPDDQTKVYGQVFSAFTGTITGILNGDNITANYSSPGALATATVAGSPYTITATLNDPDNKLQNYNVVYNTAELTVTRAPLTITASNQTKPYGTLFTFAGTEFSTSGLLNADTVTSATLSSTGAPAAMDIGDYPILISGAVGTGLGNYNITYVDGTLTVTKATANLVVTPDNKTKVYGEVFSAFTGTITGLLNGDNITASYSSPGAAATATVAGSPYTITATLNDPDNKLQNYNVVYNTGLLTVTRAALTITANDQFKTYGALFAFDGDEFTTSGLLNADTVTSATITSPGAAAAATVAGSPYVINISNAVGTGLGNYNITYVPGEFVVGTATLTVTADNKIITYGSPDPIFTFSYSGFMNGETAAVLTTQPSCTVSGPHINAGAYPIVCSGGVDDNYSFNYVNGTLTVNPHALTVTPDNKTKAYGDTFTAFTGTVNGIQYSDNITASYSSTGAPASATVGSYPITATLNDPDGKLGNYTVTYNTGTLTVVARDLTVTPDNKTKVYGDNFTAFTGTISGLQNGDPITAIYASTGAAPTATVTGSPYPITVTLNDPAGRLPNYNVIINSAQLTVTQRPLIVTPDNKAKVYGTTFTAFTGSIVGIQNGENITATYSSPGAIDTAPVGVYPINTVLNDPGGFLPNYAVTINPATLTVGNTVLTVTADPQTKVYGDPDPVFTFTYSGFVGGDGPGDIDTPPTCAVNVPHANAGTYPITCSGGLDDNYIFLYVSNNLIITQRPLVVTPDNQTKVYGDTFTAFTGTITGVQAGDNIGVTYSSPGAAATATVASSPYPITAALSDPGNRLPNYTVTLNTGLLTVTRRDLVVTPDDKTKVYGDNFSAFTGTVTGLQAGDGITVTYASTGAPAAATVNTYPITATLNDPLSRLPNYNVTLNTGTLTVTERDLVVTPGDKIKTYGDLFTAFTGTISGLQNGDPITANYSSPGAAATATVAGSPYPITATLVDPTGRLGNYNVILNTGSLTVNPRDLVVIPADKIKTYGTLFTAFTGNIVGIQNNDPITATYASAGAPAAAPVGFYPITATLNDPSGRLPNYNVSYNTGTLTVNQASTITAVNSSVNPADFGEMITFTATVSAIYGTPTGDVTFYDGVTPLGTYALTGGTASFSIDTLSVGVHIITAIYSGDLNYLGSTSAPYSQGVGQSATATLLTSNVNPSVFGQLVTFTATVTSGSGIPTGDVTFRDGATTIGTAVLTGGVATFSTSSLAVGSHSLTAVYAGNSEFFTSTSPAYVQTVNKADTTTGLVSSVNPSVSGQSVTFTATVASVAPGAGTPTGTVIFRDGATLLGSSSLSGGSAAFSTSALSVGSHNITASYGGDDNFNTSVSTILVQVVNQGSTTTAIASSVNPSLFGQPVIFTATVAAVAPAAGTPTGTVTFYDGAVSLGTGALAGGTATFSTSSLAVGSHNITAVYGGNTDFTGSTSTILAQVVNQTSTTSVVTSDANPVIVGQTVTFTATVNAVAPGAGVPTGTVTFYDDVTILGTDALDGSGQATFSTNSLAIGSHPITAVYAGNASFTGSTSPVYNQQVTQLSGTVTLSNLTHVYDGTPKHATVTTNPPGLTVIVTYDGSPSAPINAGSYAVVATISDPVYSGSASGTLVISPAPAVVNLNNLNQTYDGTPKAVTVTTVPPGLPVSVTYNGSAVPPINAGSYVVVATVIDPNYIGSNNNTLVIDKALAPVVLSNLLQTYDGTPKSVTVTTTPPGLAVTVTYDGSTTPPTEAGSYTVVATINEMNYRGSATDILSITSTGAAVSTVFHDTGENVIVVAMAGTKAHASATVSGIGEIPTGTVSFTAYNNYTCTGAGTSAGTVSLVNGVAHPSSTMTLGHGGLSVRARYNGDSNYGVTDGPCTVLVPYPQVLTKGPNTDPQDGGKIGENVNILSVEFNKDVVSDGTSAAANYVGNYLLVEDGTDNIFQTVSCASGAALTDTVITINAVTYSDGGGAGPYVATLMVNDGNSLPLGRYRLFVCGTTTIEDPLGYRLNNGLNDSLITFTVEKITPPSPEPDATVIPVTGFAPGQVTSLAAQTEEQMYTDLGDLWLEIPNLGVKASIVGVPLKNNSWDVSWLASQVGYLEGSAFPTWKGNSVLTAHVYDSYGRPGPFVNLGTLIWGNQIIIHAFGDEYVYEVRAVTQVKPTDVAKMMKHRDQPWVTLVTCKGYDANTGDYRYRILVEAVLVEVK